MTNKRETKKEFVFPERDRISTREKRSREIQKLNLLSDVFMSTALKDIPACEHILRIFTGIRDLKVKEVRTQYRISKTLSHDAILDVLAEDEQGQLYNLEIQRTDTVDHARRTRFYGAMVDSEYLAKGSTYSELPEVHIFYISEKDLWSFGETVYPVNKYFGDTGIPYDDGFYVTYINTEIDDGTEAAKLMKYFKTADPFDMSQGELSERVHFLKCEEGGLKLMCEISEKWLQEGIEIGREEGRAEGRQLGHQEGIWEQARKSAIKMAELGYPVAQIAQILEVSTSVIGKWLQNPVSGI